MGSFSTASLLGNASNIFLKRPNLHPSIGSLGVEDTTTGLLEGLTLGDTEDEILALLGTAETISLGPTEGSFVEIKEGTFEGAVVGIADG